jgi:hypothetical protein
LRDGDRNTIPGKLLLEVVFLLLARRSRSACFDHGSFMERTRAGGAIRTAAFGDFCSKADLPLTAPASVVRFAPDSAVQT